MEEEILRALRYSAWCDAKAALEKMFGYYNSESKFTDNKERFEKFYNCYTDFIVEIENNGFCD